MQSSRKPKFIIEVEKDVHYHWCFRIKCSNGKVLARSRSFKDKPICYRVVNTLKRGFEGLSTVLIKEIDEF